MYVFLKEGPVHICAHRQDSSMLLVRGWSEEALKRFLTPTYDDDSKSVGMTADPFQSGAVRFWRDDTADYCFRAEAPRPLVVRCAAAAVERITYDSLKAGVAADGNHEYYNQLVEIHALCKALMDPRRQA